MKKYSTSEKDINNFLQANKNVIESKGLDDVKEKIGMANKNYKRATSTTLGKIVSWIGFSIIIVLIVLLLIGIFTANVFQNVKFIFLVILLIATILMFRI